MDHVKRLMNFGVLTKIVSAAIVLGFIFGIGKGLLFIHLNRYLELQMYNIAFSYFRAIVNDVSLIFLFITPVVFLIVFFMYSTLAHLLKDTMKGERYTYFMVIPILLFPSLFQVGYFFNKLDGYPDRFSLKGIIYNSIIILSFIFLGTVLVLVISKTHLKIRRFLLLIVHNFFRLRFALSALFLLLMLNGLFYFHQLQLDRKGLNVLFITVDTLRADHLGVYGYERATSPNIDRLAEEGILFSQAVTQWPQTVGSLTSLMTGTYRYYHDVTRMWADKLSNQFVLLPEILKNAGYNTIAVTPDVAVASNLHQGFDPPDKASEAISENYDAEEITAYALSWLKGNADKGKFFMWLHYADPHTLYEPPDSYDEMYVDDKYYDGSKKLPFILGPQHYFGGIAPNIRLADNDVVDYYIAQYDAEIRYMDESVGNLLDTMKTMGIDENTIIIFTADHGESLGDHNYYFGHGLLPYDASSRVPLILKTPDRKSKGKVRNSPVQLIDIMPTVLDVLNIPVNQEVQGKSLIPSILEDRNGISEYAFSEAGVWENYQHIIRTKKWKLIHIPNERYQRIMRGMPFELYDIENDPNELDNLIEVETQIAEKLKKELFSWLNTRKPKVR